MLILALIEFFKYKRLVLVLRKVGAISNLIGLCSLKKKSNIEFLI